MPSSKHLIYTNDIWEMYGSFDNMEAAMRECQEIEEADAVDENTVYAWAYGEIEFDFDDFWSEVKSCDTDHHWLVIADLGLWNGRARGGRVFNTLPSALSAVMDNMDNITIREDQYGRVTCECIHHDGRNHYELRRLSGAGEKWYQANGLWASREEVCETLAAGKHYTRGARLRELFGWISARKVPEAA